MAAQVEDLKWVRGTDFIVDGFRFQHPRCKHYFLTHAHSDHTTGLYRSFSSGQIYCTPVTAALLVRDQGIPALRITAVPLDEAHTLNGVRFTFMDANHCPGAAMILFEVILHTGDMRWQHSMARHPALQHLRVDLLYLDTTYAAPKHVHPPQAEAIATMVALMRQLAEEEPRTIFVVGAYHIGKERAYLGPARQLGYRVYCKPAKLRVLKMLGLPAEDLALLTSDPAAARIHVSFMGKDLLPEALLEKMATGDWPRIVAFRPTGWTFRKSGKLEVRRQGAATVYGVPYSEHSNFLELRDCVASLRPKHIIPTVNVTDPASSRRLVDLFADGMDLSADRSRLDSYFRRNLLQLPVCLSAALPARATVQKGSLREESPGYGAANAISTDESIKGEAEMFGRKLEGWKCGNTMLAGSGQSCSRTIIFDLTDDMAGDECSPSLRHSVRKDMRPSTACTLSDTKLEGPQSCIHRTSAATDRSTSSSNIMPSPTAGLASSRPLGASTMHVECNRSGVLTDGTAKNQLHKDAATSDILADVNVNEQAALIAMFEARRQVTPHATPQGRKSWKADAPTLAGEAKQPPGKRQKTLLGFFGLS